MPLRTTPLTLHGGCFCGSIRYKINIPSLSERPLLEKSPNKPFGPQTDVEKRLPVVSFDHCHTCRHVTASVMLSWLICPQRWAEFTVLPRSDQGGRQLEGEREDKIKISTQDLLTPSPQLESQSSIRSFRSSEHVVRTFCGTCGTPLSYYYDGPDSEMAKPERWGPYFDITLGSLDDEFLNMKELRPTSQVHGKEAMGWLGELLEKGEEAFSKEEEVLEEV